MLKFYWYSKCSTCRKAKKALDEANVAYSEIDITMHPPSAADFKKWLKQDEIELKTLLNTSGQEYRKLNVKEKLQTEKPDAIIKMLAANGRLVKRPIITDGKKITIGFRDPEAIINVWKL